MARGRSIIGSLPTDGNPQAPQPPADPEPKQGAKAQKGKSTSIIGSLPTAGGGPAAPTPAAEAPAPAPLPPAPAPLPPAPSPLAPAPAASKPKGRKRKSDSLIGDLPGDQASPSTPAQAQPAAQTKKPKAAKSGSLIGSLPEPQEAKPPPAPAPVPLPAAQTPAADRPERQQFDRIPTRAARDTGSTSCRPAHDSFGSRADRGRESGRIRADACGHRTRADATSLS